MSFRSLSCSRSWRLGGRGGVGTTRAGRQAAGCLFSSEWGAAQNMKTAARRMREGERERSREGRRGGVVRVQQTFLSVSLSFSRLGYMGATFDEWAPKLAPRVGCRCCVSVVGPSRSGNGEISGNFKMCST